MSTPQFSPLVEAGPLVFISGHLALDAAGQDIALEAVACRPGQA